MGLYNVRNHCTLRREDGRPFKKGGTVLSHDDYKTAKAIFTDLDGTVRYSNSGTFINKPEDIVLYRNVEKILWEYKNKGYLIFGVTNQGGVAFRIKTIQGVYNEIRVMRGIFVNDPFDGVICSFNHEKGKPPFNKRSLLRKPGIGMIATFEWMAIERGFILDLDNSIFVGDRPEDKECSSRAGIPFHEARVFFQHEEGEGNE